MSLQDGTTLVDDTPPEYVKGGLVRRTLALGVDLIVAEVLLQLAVALLFPLTGGRLVDTNAVFTSCVPTVARPENLEVPPGFEGAQAQLCTKSILDFPTARIFVLSKVDPATQTNASFGFALDADDRIAVPFDAAGLQVLAVALLRWALERCGWRSPGRKWLSLVVVMRRGDPTRALDRRYVLFALSSVPGVAAALITYLFELAGGSPAAEPLTVLTFVGTLPLTVALLAATGEIWQRRDPFYDAHAGTTTAQLFDGHLEVAPDALIPFTQYWTGRAPRAPGRVAAAQQALPWLTLVLAAALTLVFAGEIALAARVGSNGLTTAEVLCGAASGELVRDAGQWYRLATAMFLHASLAHLLGNLVVLVGAGWLLEGVLGRGWLLSTFLLGGIAASSTSVTVNAPNLLSLGASGAITAVVAAGVAVTTRLAADERRLWTRAFCLACLLAAMQASGRLSWGLIDRAAHIGGALAGAGIGFVISLLVWPLEAQRPRYGRVALGASLAVVLGLFASVPWGGFGDASMSVLLVPADEAPKSDDEWVARSADIVRRYPSDWRGHLARASAVGGDASARDQEIDLAIADLMRVGVSRAKAEENAYEGTGWGRERAGDWSAAERLYGRALTANPAAMAPRIRRLYVEQAQGEFEAARTDAMILVQAHPEDGKYASRLAEVLLAAGNLDDAVAFGRKAVSLKPNDEQIVRLQGWMEFLASQATAKPGSGESGVTALKQATTVNPRDAYAALWLDIASARTGSGGSPEAFDALPTTVWPGPVVAFYRGEMSEDQLMAAADATTDATVRKGQHCEAVFYVAEWQLMRDARAAAWPRLKEAVATCPKTFDEFGSAEAELKQVRGADDAQP